MEDMSTGKADGKEKAATKGHHRRRRSQKYKEEKMERREGGYWTVSGREPGLTSQT